MLCLLIVCGIVNEKLTQESVGLRTEVFFLFSNPTEYRMYVNGINNSGIPEGHSKKTFLSRFDDYRHFV